MKEIVILINPFTSVEYYLDFMRNENIAVCAFYTSKQLKRSGYVLTELNKAKFDITLYGVKNLDSDLKSINKAIGDYKLIYSFVCSELDDFEYCEQFNRHLIPHLSNDPRTSHMRYDKYHMHEALKVNKVNYIKQCMGNDYTPGLFKNHGVVVKPVSETCSEDGVVVFENENKAIAHLSSVENLDKTLIQERIEGEEYVVDAFTFKGQHYIIGILKYETDNEALSIMQHVGSVNINASIGIIHEYAIKVLNALDVRNGFSHMEAMVTKKDKCYLIELNPRLPGAAGFVEHLDEISYSRHHLGIWNDVVHCNNNPEQFPSSSGKYSTIFFLYNHSYAYQAININIIKELPSFIRLKVIKDTADKPLFESRLNTVAFILLAHGDRDIIKEDIITLTRYQEEGDAFIKS